MLKDNEFTLVNYVNSSFERFADHTALALVDGKKYTYAEVGTEVDRFQKILRVKGIDKGDKVAILSANNPWWGMAFFARLFKILCQSLNLNKFLEL